MSRYRVRIVALVAAVTLLAACAAPPKAPLYGHWSYVYTKLDPFWWTEVINLNDARKAGTGTGATVAIVGTGVLAGHEDIATIIPGVATCGKTPDDTNDSNGHGTQLAGIAVGRDLGHATRGVAPGAALIPIKVDCGVVSAEALTKGVEAAIARKPDVILIAIGGYPAGPPDVSTFMSRLVTANPGILFVVASAWDGTYFAFPAWTQADNALTVAAMTLDAVKGDITKADKTREIPYSERRGHIWAPGRNVATADIEMKPGATAHSKFLMHGTSPAAAVVAGCAALVKGKTGKGGAGLKSALLSGTDAQPELGPASNGRLNCARALQ
jgi:subtilisin family serine protease